MAKYSIFVVEKIALVNATINSLIVSIEEEKEIFELQQHLMFYILSIYYHADFADKDKILKIINIDKKILDEKVENLKSLGENLKLSPLDEIEIENLCDEIMQIIEYKKG
jgi:hypothetical protein